MRAIVEIFPPLCENWGTLQNLVGIARLKAHKAAPEISRLLASAAASLADAKRQENSLNSRLDLAYKAIMQSALAALMANGYRPSTSEPGHQQTTIQTLPKTIGLAPETGRATRRYAARWSSDS